MNQGRALIGQQPGNSPKTYQENLLTRCTFFFSDELITRNLRQRALTSHKQTLYKFNFEIMYQKNKIYP